jgi:putative hydrolase of the HAD superfamily
MAAVEHRGATAAGYRAVLLDALGTLVELDLPWIHLRRTLRDRHGIEVSEADAREAMLAEMAYYREHHREGRDEESLAELRGRCARLIGERIPVLASLPLEELTDLLLDSIRFRPYDDTAPALARLRAAGLRLAVVSNWDCSLRGVLAELGLAGALDEVVVSAEVGVSKPDPGIFRAALEHLRCTPADALFVGDSLETDVLGARAAGIRGLLLQRNGGRTDDQGVERIFDLGELPELVARARRG